MLSGTRTLTERYSNYVDSTCALYEESPMLASRITAAVNDYLYGAVQLARFQFLTSLLPSISVGEDAIMLRSSPLRDLLSRLIPVGTDDLTLTRAVEVAIGVSLDDLALRFEYDSEANSVIISLVL